ncbi:tyrosine-protein phosphatase [Saliterribacillus persicus]|uniref:Tyrosine-protein phosphatase n=1 Tax=Saliterribacillus persicus TaxID=930114 RepID=A0A368YAU2_9BACI|nr:CpsB/CapC family capsule biosynthesis tyrosine phosphatase [Saliterribacillus persicus]RCW77380.1 protein-tyrosine phosphatase [Saliterribacillus persicus]
MIDVNCYILPNFGEGAKHMEESVAIAKEAENQGVKSIIASPKQMIEEHHFFIPEVIEGVRELNNRLEKEHVKVNILTGQTVPIHGDIIEMIDADELLFLNNTKYMLMDLPENHLPQYTSKVIYDLQLRGYQPIIAHPEKYGWVEEEPNAIYELVKAGALIQVCSSSVIGAHGKRIEKLSKKLIEHNLVHLVASEAKDRKHYHYKKALDSIRKEFGHNQEYYFIENGFAVANDEPVIGNEPLRIKVKKIFGLF